MHGRLVRAIQVCSKAVVVGMGVNAVGHPENLGLKVGESESADFWSGLIGSI